MAEKKSSNSLLPTIGIIVITQTVLMIAFWYLLVPKLLENEKPKPKQDLALIENLQKQEQQEQEAKQDTTKKNINLFKRDDTDYLKERSLYSNEKLNGLAVHPVDNSDAYLVVSMGFEYLQKNAKVSEELGLKLDVAIDRLITWFSSQEIDYLSDIRNRPEIKNKIKELVNNVLTKGEITRVVFTQYLIQK